MEFTDPETGEVARFRQKGVHLVVEDTPVSWALRRHELLGTARSILSQFKADDGYARYRTSYCNFSPTGDHVEVFMSKNPITGCIFANFSVQHCGSVWLCPVCAARISSVRAERIQRTIEGHKNKGGFVAFLTLTLPHVAGNKLQDELELWDTAMKKFSSGKAASLFRAKHGIVGLIRALEITHGRSGWHVHAHLLLFFEKRVVLEEFKPDLYVFWQRCSKFSLRNPSYRRGVDVRPADEFVSTYMSKWGVSDEMTRSHIKTGRKNASRTPFELLADARDGDGLARLLFAEYADCFVKPGERCARSRKQIFTSRSLSQEASEEEDAKEIMDSGLGDKIGQLSREWFRLLQDENAIGLALELVKADGMQGLHNYITCLEGGKRDPADNEVSRPRKKSTRTRKYKEGDLIKPRSKLSAGDDQAPFWMSEATPGCAGEVS